MEKYSLKHGIDFELLNRIANLRRRHKLPKIYEWGSRTSKCNSLFLSSSTRSPSIVYWCWEMDNISHFRNKIHGMRERELSFASVLREWDLARTMLDKGGCSCQTEYARIELSTRRWAERWDGCCGCQNLNTISIKIIDIIGNITRQRITSWPMILELSELRDRLFGLLPSSSCQTVIARLCSMLAHFFDRGLSSISYATEAASRINITAGMTVFDLMLRATSEVGSNINLIVCNPWHGVGPTWIRDGCPKDHENPKRDLEELLEFFIVAYLLHLFKILLVVQILLSLICILFVFWEYPNRRRHACTTMPWTIWPALVVLWGVCWMFYGPEVDQYDLQSDLENEGEWATQFAVNLEWEWMQPIDLDMTLNPSHLDAIPKFGIDQSLDLGSDMAVALPMQALSDFGNFDMDFGPVFDTRSSNDSQPQEGTERSQPTTSATSFHGPKLSAADQSTKVGPIRRFMCSDPTCNSQAFRSSGELNKHVNRKHSKPYTCDDCDYACGSKSDLVKHRQTHQRPELFCPSATCKRSINAEVKKPFGRQDNLDDHIKRVHGPDMRPASVSSGSKSSDMTFSGKGLKRRREISPSEGEDMVQKNRFLEEQLKQKNEELEKKDEEIKWLKQLVDRLMPGSNGAA